MPSIQIRESAPYHFYSRNLIGAACKYLVEQLVALDPMLSIANVVADSDANYRAYIKVADSNVGFEIKDSADSSRSIYIYTGVWKSDGSFARIGTYYASSFFEVGSSGTSVKVSTVGVDGVLMYAAFTSSYSSASVCAMHGMFTSDVYENPVYVVSGTTGVRPSWPTPLAVPFCTALPNIWYNPELDINESIAYHTYSGTYAWSRSGYSYALQPNAYAGYSNTVGFGNIKWGGSYDLYPLWDSSGAYVTTLFGETVSINGVSSLSGGNVALIV